MPKRKVRKAPQRPEDPVADEKVRKLKELMSEFKVQQAEYERYLTATCEQQNDLIDKLYMDKLATIPEHIRNMTIAEVMAHQEKERARKTECPKDETAIRSMFERTRATSEKKRTLRKERKRSISVNASTRPLTINRPPTNAFMRISRAISDPTLNTPAGKLCRMSNMVITPKFNPNQPVSKMARKPKPNEILMSLSGSPLQNIANGPNIAGDSKVTLSFGQGKVLTFDEEANIDADFVNKIDEPMKKMLKDVQEKIDKILQS